MRIVIVGGGVLGTMHAWVAVTRGHSVVHLEREQEARGASVRNFGLVWVSGRAPGPELGAALRGRALWEEIGARVPGIGFRPAGSLTIVRTAAELAVAEDAVKLGDAGEREFALLGPAEVRALNPALRGELLAALWCGRDAVVEPRSALPAVRAQLAASGRYEFVAGREARTLESGTVADDAGHRHECDLAVLCPGAALSGLARELAPGLPLRRVRLQMLQTEPSGERLTTAVADADSFRYYPAFAGPALDDLRRKQPQPGVAAGHRAQLLLVQRLDGALTIGDTHAYDEPFAFDVDEAPYEHLLARASALLGRPVPPPRRRWAGVYAQCTDPGELAYRREVRDGVWLVAGPGGRGMTIAPALAEQTADLAGL